PPPAPAKATRSRPWRKWLLLAGAVAGPAGGGDFLVPPGETAPETGSPHDAFFNRPPAFLGPPGSRPGATVLVDDNYRVKKGDLLVQLDKEPFQVQVALKKAAVVSAEADLVAANSQVRALVAAARANRFQLQHAMEDVNTQIANLRAAVATL